MNPPRFEEMRRGDAGRDGGGIYRNIARETRIPNILTKGKYSTIEWVEICRLLASKTVEDRLQVILFLSLYFLSLIYLTSSFIDWLIDS